MFAQLLCSVDWNKVPGFCCCSKDDKDQGGQGNASATRPQPPQMGAGWFPSSGSNAMPSKTEDQSVPSYAATAVGFGRQASGEEDEEMRAADAAADIDAEPLNVDILQSYYERDAAERAQEEADEEEESDSDEEDELKEFQDEMKKAHRQLQKQCGEEKSRLRKSKAKHWNPDVNANMEFEFNQMEIVAENLDNVDPEEDTGATKEPPKNGAPDAPVKKKKIQKGKSPAGLNPDDMEVINMRYENKVREFLKDDQRPDDFQEHVLGDDLVDYQQAMRDRLGKLSGKESKEEFSPAKDRAEAVKECVRKYNEECERLGLYKAFSAEDVPEDGLGNQQRSEMLDNVKKLSEKEE